MEALRNASRESIRNLLRARAIRQRPSIQTLRLQPQPTFRTRPSALNQTRCMHSQPRRPLASRVTSKSTRTTQRPESTDAIDSKPDSQLSLSQRLKKLSREYGWAALYVYLGLTALDFPFCFLAVKMIGTDTVGHWEHVVVSYVKGLLQWPISGTVQESVGDAVDKVEEAVGTQEEKRVLEEGGEPYPVEDHGYKEAEKANSGSNASIWTQLALAYAIHKSFIFVRVPLTAAITPKVVKTLRGWGWNIGRPTRKGMSTGKSKTSAGVGVNTKGSKVKPDD